MKGWVSCDRAHRLFFQVVELRSQFGELAVHRQLGDLLFVDLDTLVDNHLRPLESAGDGSKDGVSRGCREQNHERNYGQDGRES